MRSFIKSKKRSNRREADSRLIDIGGRMIRERRRERRRKRQEKWEQRL